MVLFMINIPPDTLALAAMDWVEPNAIVWGVALRCVREASVCDLGAL